MSGEITSVLSAISPTYKLMALIADKLMGISTAPSITSDLPAVRAETERQENEMLRLEAQAKVAQEMAIASRIESAIEVEIEEFYEYAGESNVGLTLNDKAATLGMSGSGKRVSKRVIRFTGHVSAAAPSANTT